jgi:hypothetical protein
MLIGSEWREASSGEGIETPDPATVTCSLTTCFSFCLPTAPSSPPSSGCTTARLNETLVGKHAGAATPAY